MPDSATPSDDPPPPDRDLTSDLDPAGDHLPAIYDELRALAGSYMSNKPSGHTLQPTAIVHEAYLRLAQKGTIHVNSKTHFFSLAAQAMRWVLADHARHRTAKKRGGQANRITLDESLTPAEDAPEIDIEALNAALVDLGEKDPRAARIVELRFLAGLSIADTAQAMELSVGTIKNEWRWVRTWLLDRLGIAQPTPKPAQ